MEAVILLVCLATIFVSLGAYAKANDAKDVAERSDALRRYHESLSYNAHDTGEQFRLVWSAMKSKQDKPLLRRSTDKPQEPCHIGPTADGYIKCNPGCKCVNPKRRKGDKK